MKATVYTFHLSMHWEMIALLSKLDRFDATWTSVEKWGGPSLKQLRTIATIRSVGASTRIEGSNLSDDEVDTILQNLEINKLDDRDTQEVLGYFETLDLILESYLDIDFTIGSIKNLHNLLLKHCPRDEWHRGDYKKNANAVAATLPDGTSHIVFKPTEPGFPTQDAMQSLLDWYDEDDRTHPLVKCAVFTYEFLSIHPFQDGNGRLSRLLSTLFMMKHGYSWIQYVSFENEIEDRKKEYYRELRNSQSNRPGEDIGSWVEFYLRALLNLQFKLDAKLKSSGKDSELSANAKSVLVFVEGHSGCRSGQIAARLGIPSPSVKKILSGFVKSNLIIRHGRGPGTHYSSSKPD